MRPCLVSCIWGHTKEEESQWEEKDFFWHCLHSNQHVRDDSWCRLVPISLVSFFIFLTGEIKFWSPTSIYSWGYLPQALFYQFPSMSNNNRGIIYSSLCCSKSVWLDFLYGKQKKMLWKMSVFLFRSIGVVLSHTDIHLWTKTAEMLFRIAYFVFHKIQSWNDVTVSQWWLNFHLWMKYLFKRQNTGEKTTRTLRLYLIHLLISLVF